MVLTRERPRNGATPGSLSFYGPIALEPEIHVRTLEDAPVHWLGGTGTLPSSGGEFSVAKEKGKTAIAAGRYRVGLSQSARFGKLLPELFDVPHFTAIRIHGGNRPEDTDGCILVGMFQMIDGAGRPLIYKSAPALQAVIKTIAYGLRQGDRKVWLEIRNGWL